MEIEPQLVESCTLEVVDCIKQFIDALRSEFPLTTSSAQSIPLYSRLKDKGFVDNTEKTLKSVEERIGANKFALGRKENNNKHDERRQIVYNILLPMLQSLEHCYEILDQLPTNTDGQNIEKPKSARDKKKPKAPIGMLSIQNYTDIACLLEFTVLTSILPLIEKHILISFEDRIRYQLPKSLAGRINRSSLSWGSTYHKAESEALRCQELIDTASTIASLIMSDRFKPMLLPRHLADIYAGLFQAECLGDGKQQEDTKDLYANLGLASAMKIDASVQAKAYQTLLLQGTKSPTWLRQRVSPLLSQLACKNLGAIIQVFCPVSESSTASQRLGRALSTAPSKKALCQQMLGLLQFIYPTNGEIPARAMAILETIWAVLNQWPSITIKRNLIELWEMGIFDENNKYTIHATIRQIGALFSFVPPSANPMKVLEWIPRNSIFQQLVRLASMPSVLSSTAKTDAKQTLLWLSEAIGAVERVPNVGNKQITGQTILVTIWVHSLAPYSWDFEGNTYYFIESLESESKSSHPQSLQAIGIKDNETSFIDLNAVSKACSDRVDVFFEFTNFLSEKSSISNLSLTGLFSKMFQLLMRLYLSSSDFRFVSMLVLPRLVERALPEELLFGDTEDAMEFLSLVKLILVSVRSKCKNQSVGLDTFPAHTSEEDNGMVKYLLDLQRTTNSGSKKVEATSFITESNSDEDESILSIASIILSVLISVLELGSKLRSAQEEDILKSILPILASLSELNNQEKNSNALPSQDSSAAIADMSGYAMALIASRSAPLQSTETEGIESLATRDKLNEIISDAEKDLQSTEPPIRARGMVSLGRLARGYLGILTEESLAREKSGPLIVELQQESKEEEDNAISFLTQEVLRLSMIALADEESYVYLAAVQTVVAVGDVQPKKVLPVVAFTLVTGFLKAGTQVTTTLTSDIRVTQEQRIKLAEALIFIIRRRAVVDEFVPVLLSLMAFGRVQRTESNFDDRDSDDLIQNETHKYFVGNDELESEAKSWEEREIRLNTGGPIFKSEEFDLVRAARASVLAEVVSNAKPSSLVPYCKLLVRLAIDTLTLDSSRIVCRSIALLVRELYSCLLSEFDTQTETSIPFTVAFISSDEELLFVTIQAYATGIATKSKGTFNDTATSARCKEAIILREQAEEAGFLSAARLFVMQTEANKTPNFLNIVQPNDKY